MAEHRFTPGPWRYTDESRLTPHEPFWISAEHPAGGFVSHAVVRSGCTESDELGDREANARLIAAAPDLFDAVYSVIWALDKQPDHMPDAIRHARAALAKATGATS